MTFSVGHSFVTLPPCHACHIVIKQRLQPCPPFRKRCFQQHRAILVQQIVRHKDHRCLGQQFVADGFAAQARLECLEGQNMAITRGQKLAIENELAWQYQQRRVQFGEAVSDLVERTREKRQLIAGFVNLGANAVVLILDKERPFN